MPVGQEFGSGLPEWFWLGIFHEVAIRILTDTQSSEGFHSMMTDWPGWQVNAACWQRASVLCHVDFFIGLHVCHTMAAGFPWAGIWERQRASGICSIFYYLAVACHFIRELHKVSVGILAKRQECLEGSSEAGYYSSQGRKLRT